jgi:hypothetical protein
VQQAVQQAGAVGVAAAGRVDYLAARVAGDVERRPPAQITEPSRRA